MRAMVLRQQGPAEQHPLRLEDVQQPTPAPGEVRVRVSVCGVCHTDLHIVEGDIHPPALPLIPGHQVVGAIEALGPNVKTHREGDRVGIPWLYSTDGTCAYCRRGQENLCEAARFTGFHVNGGYTEFVNVPAESAYPVPKVFTDLNAAPLLCAGVIGYRSYRLSGIHQGETIVLLGFGGSAHIVLQLAKREGCTVYVITRSEKHQQLARELGAAWVGIAQDQPPSIADAAIVFAPAGALVPRALRAIRKGGTVALAGITMSDIPQMPYELLYHERILRSVANSTHQDVRDFLSLAAEIPVRTTVDEFPLEQANEAILAMKHSKMEGAAVLRVA
ncbi:MAG TPA: zinc-dependent alcohol dehydrogenase family protein [Terriglobales bacterium]|nr:zinc-dependent alcohol dehydrogenase family protein [Terriglobales bacterium]